MMSQDLDGSTAVDWLATLLTVHESMMKPVGARAFFGSTFERKHHLRVLAFGFLQLGSNICKFFGCNGLTKTVLHRERSRCNNAGPALGLALGSAFIAALITPRAGPAFALAFGLAAAAFAFAFALALPFAFASATGAGE